MCFGNWSNYPIDDDRLPWKFITFMSVGPLKVLVVEDSTDDFASLKRTFSKSRYDFDLIHCVRAEDALALIHKDLDFFDVVVTDYSLPGITGLEFAQQLLDLKVPFPLLMLTGHGNETAAVQALKIGIFDYIVKDATSDEFKLLPEKTIDAVNKRERDAQALRTDNQIRKLSAAVEQCSSIILITDAKGMIDYVNAAFTRVTGYILDEVQGKNPSIMESELTPAAVYRDLSETIRAGQEWRGELRYRKKNGDDYWARTSISPVKNQLGEVINFVEIQDDITEARILSDKLYYQEIHDSLTGLINRQEFENRLQKVLQKTQSDQSEHALFYLDLDQFKIINDTCGHVAGDELLCQLSTLLKGSIRKCDTLARLGGDEFGVLMEYCPLDKAEKMAHEQRQLIENFNFAWKDQIFKIGVSIGLVPISGHSGHLSDILKDADAACYAAKDQGRNRVYVYDRNDERVTTLRGHMQWVARINQALEKDSFILYFQTIIPVDQQVQEGDHYELLLRLEENGQIFSPNAFLPAAERYNLSGKIDRWVVGKALNYFIQDKTRLDKLHQCAINLSGQTLGDDDFLVFVVEKLKETGVPPEKICFEITETAAIININNASRVINELRELGCRFALDDFGSGLSSFAYLKHLPVDFLKIDGIFVKDIVDDPIDFAMVKSINDIGHVMGKKTIAEFVESDEILQKLRSIGVDYAQGYAISKPNILI